MVLQRDIVVEKMKERGFTVYAAMGDTKIHFVSERMYDFSYESRVLPRNRVPVINVVVNLTNDEFECTFNVPSSINQLRCGPCGSVMSDDHFDNIVAKFESHAKWLSRLVG